MQQMTLFTTSSAQMCLAVPSCQVWSWPGVTPLEASCMGAVAGFPAHDDALSTVVWCLCQEHRRSLTTCWGCGRQSALGPYNLHGVCLHCVSAAQWGQTVPRLPLH
jgi:hypothetical protein